MDVSCIRISHLVNFDDSVKKIFNAISRGGNSWNDRHTEHFAKILVIKFDSTTLQLIKHIQVYNHRPVHIDKLSGQIKIPLKIGSNHHIDYDIRCFLSEITHHIKLLRRICRQGICAGKINYIESIPFMFKRTCLCTYCDACIVSDVFMCTGYPIE